MKFHQVALQQQFIYRNRLCIKTGPLTASCIETGKEMLVPRHADVSAAGEKSNVETKREPVLLDARQVQNALQVFHESIVATIADLKQQQADDRLSELENIIDRQWSSLLDSLELQE